MIRYVKREYNECMLALQKVIDSQSGFMPEFIHGMPDPKVVFELNSWKYHHSVTFRTKGSH